MLFWLQQTALKLLSTEPQDTAGAYKTTVGERGAGKWDYEPIVILNVGYCFKYFICWACIKYLIYNKVSVTKIFPKLVLYDRVS